MKNREITTTVTYNRNCHYNESSQSQPTFVPLVAPAISIDSITITNVSNPNAFSNNQPIFYYNDVVQVTITIPNVTYGSVSFYFIDKTDLSQTPQLINKDSIEIDNDGNASIQYIPHNHGTFRIEYHGDPYYDDAVAEKPIDLTSRPTHIKFNEYPPYLVNPQDTVEMSVTVIDKLTDEPLNYGLVTFLNYYDYNERIEKVIGNSKYLINGQASIKYSPIQLNHSNDLLSNIELIRASYNYNKTEYDVFWDYYDMHDDWTSIAIRRANQVNILIPQILDGASYKSLEVNGEALFVATQQDSLLFRCEVTVTEDLDTTSTPEEKKVVSADVKFVVEGKQYEYIDNILQESPYYEELTAVYNQDQYYECSITSHSPLPQGLYKIYAVVDNVVKDGQTVPINNYPNTPLPAYTNTDKNIVDGLYLKSNISEEFYIKIEPETNDNLKLNLSNKRSLITNHTLNSNDLEVEIDGNLDAMDKKILPGQTCYFYISGINKHLQGTIVDKDGHLTAKPTNVDTVTINTLGDYVIQAYIKDGDYKKTENNKTLLRHYNTTYSNNVIVKVRNQLNITLTKNTINNIYPGNIRYTLKGENISSSDVIQVEMFIDNESIGQHNLTSSSSMVQQKQIPPQSVGQHTLKAVVLNEEFNVTPIELNFEIATANLNISINPDSKFIYSASPTDIYLDIEHANQFNIGDIDLSKFDISVIHSSGTTQHIQFAQSADNILTKVNNKKYQIRVPCKLYDEGQWQIVADYKGDGCYNKIENNILNFNVITKIPSLINTSLDEDSINNLVYDVQNVQYRQEQDSEGNDIQVPVITYEPCSQKLLVLNTIYQNGTNPIRFVSVTNDNGEYTLQRPNNPEQPNYIAESEWTQYNTFEYQILPKNEIINVFDLNAGATDEDIIAAFINFFNDFNELQYNVNTNEYDNILQLYQQAQNNDFITLFYGYGETSGEITLFGDEEDGS